MRMSGFVIVFCVQCVTMMGLCEVFSKTRLNIAAANNCLLKNENKLAQTNRRLKNNCASTSRIIVRHLKTITRTNICLIGCIWPVVAENI